MAISLGVGSSTLAVLNFFYALSDGKIDENERNFMGITYRVLRVSMVLILLSTATLAFIGYWAIGNEYFTAWFVAVAVLITMLFVNAILMTMRVMPSTFGPAIQASTWYTLGFLNTLAALGFMDIGLLIFFLGYFTLFLLFVAIINGVMAYMKQKNRTKV